jgi:hypothetical protein
MGRVLPGKIPPTSYSRNTDALWTKQNGECYFGYKNYVNIDTAYGFILNHSVIDASIHDSVMFKSPDNGLGKVNQNSQSKY